MALKVKRDTLREALIAQTAAKTGYTKRYVKYVLEGDRKNEAITSVYMTLFEGHLNLLKEVNTLIPFFEVTPRSQTIHGKKIATPAK